MLILHRKSQGENITELIDNNTYNNTTQHKTQSNHLVHINKFSCKFCEQIFFLPF